MERPLFTALRVVENPIDPVLLWRTYSSHTVRGISSSSVNIHGDEKII